MNREIPLDSCWTEQLPSSIISIATQWRFCEIYLPSVAHLTSLQKLRVEELEFEPMKFTLKKGEQLPVWAMRMYILMENMPSLQEITYIAYDYIEIIMTRDRVTVKESTKSHVTRVARFAEKNGEMYWTDIETRKKTPSGNFMNKYGYQLGYYRSKDSSEDSESSEESSEENSDEDSDENSDEDSEERFYEYFDEDSSENSSEECSHDSEGDGSDNPEVMIQAKDAVLAMMNRTE